MQEAEQGHTAEFRLADLLWTGVIASAILIVHLGMGEGYGFHRDELQFLSDARRLAWGYVAYPPLTAVAGRVAITLFGISPGVFRLPAAVANAVSVILAGWMARTLGGRRMAQLTAAAAVLPVALAFSSVLQYNTFDLLSWCVLVLFTARVLQTGDGRNWLGAGVGVGLGVLSKYSISFAVLSLVVALIVLPEGRRQLRSRYFWAGVLVAAVIAAPNLLWLVRHGFITLRMESSIHARDVRLGRASGYLRDQVRFTMLGLPLAIVGLVSLWRRPRFRLLSAFFLGPFVFFALAKGRGYYLLPAYPVLYAAGGVALERAVRAWRPGARRFVAGGVLAATLVDAAVVGWVYLPVWPVGSTGWNWQMRNNYDMADEIGWPEVVAQVAAVRDGLPLSDRARLAVLANNYGEAGALELWGPQYGLPTPISSVNSFHARGFGPYAPDTVIVVGSQLQDQQKNFEQCAVTGQMRIPYGVRNEESVDHPEILVCRHLRGSWPEAWAKSQEFG